MKSLALYLAVLVGHLPKSSEINKVNEGNMEVAWEYVNDRIYFEMEAPTMGWMAIGFNTTNEMTGAYLVMGRVMSGKIEVIEHYTKSPGNYRKLTELGADSAVDHVNGFEKIDFTHIRFSLPINGQNKYARDLQVGSEYIMTLAYSQSDDFQHHSIMRKVIKVKL